MTAKYGKTNKRQVLRMADEMATQAREQVRGLPDWAGLAWMVSRFYNSGAHRLCEKMGTAWSARAERICRALDIAATR